ncbi:hypothetical protein RvY_17354 [Ramazzottius varieornatus]|uniref:Uncharacterized protein n=1 Tax=Ramazzottius varieornatus TaxID=947166 RepID=A0A1D1W8W5_RAMVA|nr:hypothetical protein RvY_17354 [Ramazzottius varieornatus]
MTGGNVLGARAASLFIADMGFVTHALGMKRGQVRQTKKLLQIEFMVLNLINSFVRFKAIASVKSSVTVRTVHVVGSCARTILSETSSAYKSTAVGIAAIARNITMETPVVSAIPGRQARQYIKVLVMQ